MFVQFDVSAYSRLYSAFNEYDHALVRTLRSALDDVPKRMADVACGLGFSTEALLAGFPEATIVGVDIGANLIEQAIDRVGDPRVKFRSYRENTEMLATIGEPVDLLFIKSAYHYFEHEVPIPAMKEILTETGVVALVERTERSARSYPLPEQISMAWGTFFSDHRARSRMGIAEEAPVHIETLSRGIPVRVARDAYLEGVEGGQYFGSAWFRPEIMQAWVESERKKSVVDYEVFEEFYIYLYRFV